MTSLGNCIVVRPNAVTGSHGDVASHLSARRNWFVCRCQSSWLITEGHPSWNWQRRHQRRAFLRSRRLSHRIQAVWQTDSRPSRVFYRSWRSRSVVLFHISVRVKKLRNISWLGTLWPCDLDLWHFDLKIDAINNKETWRDRTRSPWAARDVTGKMLTIRY